MWFVWLLIYGLIFLITRYYQPLHPWVSPTGILLTAVLTIAWLISIRRGYLLLLRKARLKVWLLCFGCLFPVLCNLICLGVSNKSWLDALCTFFVAVREEILFRGIVLCFLCRRHTAQGMFLTGIVFAAAHLLNLETTEEPVVVFYQTIYALAAGLALSGVAVYSQSLLPCIGIHFLNNLTADTASVPQETTGFLFLFNIVVWLACGAICIYFQRKGELLNGRRCS